MQLSQFPPIHKIGARDYGRLVKLLTPTFILAFQIFFNGCERDFGVIQPVQKSIPGGVELSIKKISVREVWLNLKVRHPGDKIWVYRDTLKIFEGNVNVKDSTLYDFNLLPEHDYSYISYPHRSCGYICGSVKNKRAVSLRVFGTLWIVAHGDPRSRDKLEISWF